MYFRTGELKMDISVLNIHICIKWMKTMAIRLGIDPFDASAFEIEISAFKCSCRISMKYIQCTYVFYLKYKHLSICSYFYLKIRYICVSNRDICILKRNICF